MLIPAQKIETDGGQEIEITSGRWQSIKDLPGEKFGKQWEGQLTPATVKLKSGEIYRFRADFGLQDHEDALGFLEMRCD